MFYLITACYVSANWQMYCHKIFIIRDWDSKRLCSGTQDRKKEKQGTEELSREKAAGHAMGEQH